MAMATGGYKAQDTLGNILAEQGLGDPLRINYPKLDKRPETEIETVRRALDKSRELSDHVKRMVNIICGSLPDATGTDCDGECCDGILPNLASSARVSIDAMDEALRALKRLDDRLC